jgi:hypothetical protein
MIDFGRDIIWEVSQARDHARYSKTLEKLSTGDATQPSRSGAAMPDRPSFRLFIDSAIAPSARNTWTAVRKSKTEEAFRQLEQLTLQKTLEIIIPDSMAGTKKVTPGGQFWKGKLAEVLAKSISETNSVGIADRIHKAFVQTRGIAET